MTSLMRRITRKGPMYQGLSFLQGSRRRMWITRHGPRVDRWDLWTDECLNWPCVSELPAEDGHELSPILSRSHGTSDLPLGPPIAPRSRETMAAGIPGHIGMG